MQVAAPLARSVTRAAVSSTSRIPHLEYHISRRVRGARNPTETVRRHNHSITTSPALGFSPFQSQHDHVDTPADDESHAINTQIYTETPYTHTPVQSSSELNSISASDISVSDLLDEACPERLLSWLTVHPQGHAFCATANEADFERAFTSLDPDVFLDHFKAASKLGEGLVEAGKHNDITFQRSLVARLRRFGKHISQILHRRQENNWPLPLPICRHVMRCAAAVGDANIARWFWRHVMPSQNLLPDLECYNAYMRALNWHSFYSELSSTGSRNYTQNLELRAKKWRPKRLRGYAVSPQTPDALWTLRGRVLALFVDISSRKLVTNEDTFINLITGMARAGDLIGVNSILKSVWNIDVDALAKYDEEELQSPTFYQEDHPLRPSHRLLYAIVHAYSINNAIDKAIFLLDYTSRNYVLDIPVYIWEEVLERAFLLSIRRNPTEVRQGQGQGQIPAQIFRAVYDKISDAPYNIQPTAFMRLLLAKSYRDRRSLDATLDVLRSMVQTLTSHLEELKLMVRTIEAMAESPSTFIDNNILSAKFIEFRRDYQRLYLSTTSQYGLLLRQVYRVLKEPRWSGSHNETSWHSRRLPQLIEEFQDFIPEFLIYKTPKGQVIIRLHDDDMNSHEVDLDEVKSNELGNDDSHFSEELLDSNIAAPKGVLAQATVIWNALDHDDLSIVAHNLSMLRSKEVSTMIRRVQSNRTVNMW
ncbi:hypothetical protein LTR64_003227 [Lithohypha guttulata]|uniref:Pentatricopeptide repeat domain-containing protein n=1 Tax=Lithohypha guttulata TaxID=1690604 RepID=A0AAN7Y6B6_9EURO|nr:hypothetical protein LTR51_000551 [Lithohypha guttulata]KAK5085739.1 hypothetical protein LTR05_005027 [Lithohypha guttulata]